MVSQVNSPDLASELWHASISAEMSGVDRFVDQFCEDSAPLFFFDSYRDAELALLIIEFEQGGSARAEYGTGLLQTLASSLAAEFGRGFDVSNLRHMRVFYQAFPIRDALRPELSWTHYRTLLRCCFSNYVANFCAIYLAHHPGSEVPCQA